MAENRRAIARQDERMPEASNDSIRRDADLLRALAGTREVREAVGAILPPVLEGWAAGSRARRLFAGIALKVAAGGFAAGSGDGSLSGVLADPENAKRLSGWMAGALGTALGAAAEAGEGVSRLTPEDKAKVASAILDRCAAGEAGRLVTSLARTLNEALAADPKIISEKLRPSLREWVKGTDFGEIKEAADRLSYGAGDLAGAAWGEMWEYPAKVVTLMSVIPPAVNAALDLLDKTIEPINRLAPDLLTDVLQSLARETKPESIARVVDGVCEIIRKVHTGSALIGDQDRSKLPEVAAELAGGVIDSIDIGLMLKARGMLAELSESVGAAVLERVEKHPRLVRDRITARFRGMAAGIRGMVRELDLIERALSDDEVTEAVADGVMEIDAQELAGAIGRLFAILNRVGRDRPGHLTNTLVQVVGAIDPAEAREAAAGIAGAIVTALKPVAPEVLPPIIKGMAELLTPEDGERGKELSDAVGLLREALFREDAKGTGVQP